MQLLNQKYNDLHKTSKVLMILSLILCAITFIVVPSVAKTNSNDDQTGLKDVTYTSNIFQTSGIYLDVGEVWMKNCNGCKPISHCRTSNSDIARIQKVYDDNGCEIQVTAIGVGNCNVYVYFSENSYCQCRVYVRNDVNSGDDERYISVSEIEISTSSANLTVGETLQLSATILPTDATNKTLTWSSDNISVATIDSTGIVNAIAVGTATITVKTSNDLTDTCTITVKQDIFTYSNNTITGLTQYGRTLTEITIPSEIDGMKIYQIGTNAFSDYTSLSKITINEGIRKLCKYSLFYYTLSRTLEISLPKSITECQQYIYQDCSNGTIIHYQGTINDWVSINFSQPILNSKTKLYCQNILVEDINISANSINRYALNYCDTLKRVTLSNIINWDSYVFEGCYQLEEIINLTSYNLTISSMNNCYPIVIHTSSNESLGTFTTNNGINYFTYNGEKYAIGLENREAKSIVLDSDCTQISSYAFYESKTLESVSLPNSLTTIGAYTFSRCLKLTNIIIPKYVENIANYSFYNCGDIIIYCEKTEEPTGYSSNWNSNALVFWYSETQPSSIGNFWHYDTDGKTPIVWET